MTYELQQKTGAWHDARKGRVTGSRVGAILGHNPHSTRDDVMREMVRDHFGMEREFQGNEATRHGEKYEPYAIAWYEANNKVSVVSAGMIVHPQHSWIAYSPDGLVGLEGGIECKCPFYAKVPYSVFSEKKRMYLDQCLLGIECGQLDWIDFVVWVNDDVVSQERIERGDKWHKGWFDRYFPVMEQFKNEFEQIVADKKLAAQYLKPKTTFSAARVTDPGLDRLALLAQLIRSHETHIAPIREEHDKLKQTLFEKNGPCSNGLVTITCTERKGSIDYKKAISEIGDDKFRDLLPEGKDLDSYRRKAQFVYNVNLEDSGNG